MEHPEKIYKNFNIEVKEKDDDKREITAVGTKEAVDRDGDIVKVDGINLKEYKKNPLFLWAHRGSDTPENVMGNGTKVWVDGKKLMFKLNFLDADINPRADMVYKMYKVGALRAFSIGFQPSWKDAEYNEKSGGYKFNKVDLFEISAVPTPANPFALIQSKEFKGLVDNGEVDEAEVKDFEIFLRELGYEAQEDEIKEIPEIEAKLVEEDDTSEEELEELIKEVEEVLAEDDLDEELNRDNTEILEHNNVETKCVKCGHELVCPECNVLVKEEGDLFDWIFKEEKQEEVEEDEDDLFKSLGIE